MTTTPDVQNTARAYYETYWSQEGFNPLRPLPTEVEDVLNGLVHSNTRCLDVGCGDGRTEGIWLHNRTGSYVGVDVSNQAVATAASLGLDARVINDASSLPFPSNTFDLVVCFEVLEHLMFPLDAAREIQRVLKPGGALVATVPNVVYWTRRKELLLGTWNPFGDDSAIDEPWRDPHIRFFSPSSLESMLRRAGLSDIAIGGHHGTFPLCARLRLGFLQPLYTRYLTRPRPTLWATRLHATATKPLG
jgi:SAM-dependent methyltransferase